MEDRGLRKTRSDKKTGINPILPLPVYDSLCRLAYIVDRPIKEVGERFVYLGLMNREVIEEMQPLFKRAFWYSDFVMIEGNPNQDFEPWRIGPEQHRIGLRFLKVEYEKLKQLAFALDTSLTKATCLLIKKSMENHNNLADLLAWYVNGDLDEKRMKELQKVLTQINRKAKTQDEDINIKILAHYLLTQMGSKTRKITDVINDWVDEMKQVSKNKKIASK